MTTGLEELQHLRVRADYLEEANRWYARALSALVAMGELQGSGSGQRDHLVVLDNSRQYLRQLFDFSAFAFFTVNERDDSFELALSEPVSAAAKLEADVQEQIERGEFAWALGQNRAVLVPDPERKEEVLLLHVITTRRRVRGMLLAHWKKRPNQVSPAALEILSVVMNNTAYALESCELYGLLHDQSRRERELAEVTLQSIADAVIRTDAQGRLTYLNPVAERYTGWGLAGAQGRKVDEIFHLLDEGTRRPLVSPLAQTLVERTAVAGGGEPLLVARNGEERAVEVSAAPILDHDLLIGAVLVFRDVSERRRIVREMAWNASHDSLTDLLNRREFEQRVRHLLEHECSTARHHALLYLDLDQFKVVNDTCGHQAGDELLRQLASILRRQVGESDALARLGGDEFALLLADTSLEAARTIADRLIAAIQEFRFIWQGKTFLIGASIGLVAIDAATESFAGLLSAADSACYTAKEKGRNRVQLYRADDRELAARYDEMAWVARITQALEEGRFVVYHQLIDCVNESCGLGAHYEMLIRMLDEEGQLAPPGAFIPAAERYNLMPALDRWMVQAVFAGAARRTREQPATQREVYSINLSGTTLSDEQFAAFIRDQFSRHGVAPSQICFEITETAAISNLVGAVAFIDEVRRMGCAVALDDFGSGLSSFGYLKNLDVDYLKIDGAFVKDMVEDAVDCVMVEAINRVGHAMGIQTVAEYVENDAVLQRLREIGVDYAQGYGVHRPERWPWA